jgi:hypothetical protein
LDDLVVGACLTGGEVSDNVACENEEAEVRITEVFEGVSSVTQAAARCPEGPIFAFPNYDEAEAAACAEPLP